MERGSAARERERVRNIDDRSELPLERVDVRAERRDPVRRDRLVDELELAAGEVRRREVDSRHRRRAYRSVDRHDRRYQPIVPGAPLNGPIRSLVIQPP